MKNDDIVAVIEVLVSMCADICMTNVSQSVKAEGSERALPTGCIASDNILVGY